MLLSGQADRFDSLVLFMGSTLTFVYLLQNSKTFNMSQQAFKKFINQKNNAAVKEKFKQEKKAFKKERAAAIEQRFEERRALRQQGGDAKPQAARGNKQQVIGDRQDKPQATSYKGQAGRGNNQQAIGNRQDKPQAARYKGQTSGGNKQSEVRNRQGKKNIQSPGPSTQHSTPNTHFEEMPLNKFLAHCGVTSRRDSIPLIKEGKVTVDGKVVTEPGFKVTGKETVMFNGKKLFVTKNLVYILLNKPKDYLTTTDDPQGRKTVLQLIKHATSERIYPVGRLDRNTTGVLLLTNDGELTQKLTHPSYEVKKVYEVKLDKPVTKAHFEKIINGFRLEDGEIRADQLAYPDPKDKSIIGIEIHSGRNRIVRRIFEHLGYDVKALDRVMYGDLTKKNVDRGKWRYLGEKEIRMLKYLNTSQKNARAKQQA